MAKSSKAQQAATRRYCAAHYDRIELQTPKGAKQALKDHAMMHDKSVNAFILRAIRQTLQDDGAPPDIIAAVSGNGHDSSGG